MTASSFKPYISVVVTARNDDHAGNFLERMKIFMRALHAQSKRHQLPLELIVVEWNPPSERPPLREVLPAPRPNPYLRIRYLIVPPKIHQRYSTHRYMGLYQMIAKNVGIRRSTADFILCTNIDVIFSDPLAQLLATQTLKTNKAYRASLRHIPAITDDRFGDDIEALLAFCAAKAYKRQGMDPRFEHLKWHWKAKVLNKQPLRSLMLGFAYFKRRMERTKAQLYSIDTMACGDFTLIHRKYWDAIEGYLELDAYSMHIDGIGYAAALVAGCKQNILPLRACLYHVSHEAYQRSQSHAHAWGDINAPAVQELMFYLKIPYIPENTYTDLVTEMLEKKKPIYLNGPDWGLAKDALNEYRAEAGDTAFIHHDA